MINKKLMLGIFSGIMSSNISQAQLFETRATQFAKVDILQKFQTLGTAEQKELRDTLLEQHTPKLLAGESIETFFDDYYMGMIIYKDGRPNGLIGFWDPKGKPVNGGQLKNGSGTVKTPLNPNLVQNFDHESIVYIDGMKNGPVFYYCDCASVLRKGTFKNNLKEGLWKEFSSKGDYITQKYIEPVNELDEEIIIERKDWIGPAHCMMKRIDDADIKCPK